MTEQDPGMRPPAEGDEAPSSSWGPIAGPAPSSGGYEPAAASAPVTPVRPAGPRSGLRWGIALLVAAAVVAVSAAGAWLLTGRESASTLAGWMPADSVVYEELRFDLPGDQRQKLGSFLAHFPGFDDQSILDQKLAEVYDRVIRAATRDKHDYSSDIKPWFGGQVAFAVAGLPSAADVNGSAANGSAATAMGATHALAAVSVTDSAAASAWLHKILGETGTSFTTADHGGTQLLVFGSDATQAAIAVRAPVMLIGDRASVEGSLDRGGSGGLTQSANFQKAEAANDADRLAGLYLDLQAYAEWTVRLGAAANPSASAAMQTLADYLPAWMALSVRAESDALVVETAAPHNAKLPAPANAATALADHLPATTLVAYDVNDLGPTLLEALDLYRNDPTFAAGLQQIEQAANILGGFDKLLSWIGETAVVVDGGSATPSGGLVIAPRDRAAADALALQLRNLVALGGGAAGITSHDEAYAGTTITTFDLGDLSRFAGGVSLPLTGHVQLALAITDQVVVLGIGDTFVKHVLDTNAGSSLASDPRFKGLVDRIGDHNGLVFANLTAIRGLAEGFLPASTRASYEANIKPYLTPFDGIVGGWRAGGDIDTGQILVTVK